MEILNEKGAGYRILMYLLRLENPRKGYASKMNREIDCPARSSWLNINTLNDAGLITRKKEGKIKYLKLTNKGKKLASIIVELERKLK